MTRVRIFNSEAFIEVEHNLTKSEAEWVKKDIQQRNPKMPVRILKNTHGTYDVFRRESSAIFQKNRW